MNRICDMLKIDYINKSGYTGKNIGVAILDTGVSNHPDLANNIICFKDVINDRIQIYDDNGHGTHVAGITSGNGILSGGKYKGIAQDSSIVMVKCLNQNGSGKVKNALKSFDFLVKNRRKYNIRIVNISVGAVMDKHDKDNELLVEAVEELWKQGFIVVVAAGNNGPASGTITVPGCAKSVITVGASDDFIEVNLTGNKTLKNYSGRGPTNVCVVKPEIICPGTGIVSCAMNKQGYSPKSGTSMATPVVSGVIALMLEKYPDMSNKDVKRKLYETAIDMGYTKSHQGWGMINPRGLLDI